MFATPTPNEAETRELTNFGVLLAQCRWLEIYTTSAPIRQGLHLGKYPLDATPELPPDNHDGIIYYQRADVHLTSTPQVLRIPTYQHLTLVIDELVKQLYKQGVLE